MSNNNLWSYKVEFSSDLKAIYNSVKIIINDYLNKNSFKTTITDLIDFSAIDVSCTRNHLGNQHVSYTFDTYLNITVNIDTLCIDGLSGNAIYVTSCVIDDHSYTESCGVHTISNEKFEKLGIHYRRR